MDYIAHFMKTNNLKIDVPFAIRGCEKYGPHKKIFHITSTYRLMDTMYHKEHNSIFIKLLAGKYKVVKEEANTDGKQDNESHVGKESTRLDR